MLPVRWVVAAWVLATFSCAASDPWFESVLELDDTFDSVGPYLVEAHVVAPRGVESLVLRVSEEPGADTFSAVSLRQIEGDEAGGLYRAALRGRPGGAVIEYDLVLTDRAQVQVTYPGTAQKLRFSVLTPP